MKKLVLIVGLSLVIAFAATGCGGGGQQAQTTAAPDAAAETTAAETTAADTTAAETTAAAAETAAETAAAADTTAADTQAAAPDAPAAAQITEDEAKNIALQDAGLAEADVTITQITQDLDDGIAKYEVDFIAGDQEYNYDIHIETGEIIAKEVESALDD